MTDTASQPLRLIYRVHPAWPRAHVFSVDLSLTDAAAGPLVLSMPAWIPGSYMIRDFARNLIELRAVDEGGVSLPVEKRDKQTWVCEHSGGPIRISYQVYAWELSVRTAHLDLSHAYFNGPCLFLRVGDMDERPCVLDLSRPDDADCREWRAATSLRAVAVDESGFGRYRASSYLDLIDHPVEMGRFKRLSFAVAGVTHEAAVTGAQWLDEERFAKDLQQICRQHAALFGELPIDRYLFLVTAVGEGYGGLEHRYSTSLICSRDDLPTPKGMTDPKGYNRLLGLCSHEYFHLWHVKRIRPLAFMEDRLDSETHTRLLWAFEGITSYYDELALVRGGLVDERTYLGMLAETITRVWRTPGRFRQTVAESSFDAWTKFYKQDENAPNAIVSYYAKGALVALALDLRIRRDSSGRLSLDDVMRELWRRYGRSGIGVPERGVEQVAALVTGLDLEGFFRQALDSTEDLDVAGLLEGVGVGMRLRPKQGAKDLGGVVDAFAPVESQPTLDLRLRPGTAEAAVQSVISGSAGEAAGIAPGDVIVAVGGLRASADNLDRLVARAALHDEEVEIHVFRRDQLLSLLARPKAAPADTCDLMVDGDAGPMRTQARVDWLASVER